MGTTLTSKPLSILARRMFPKFVHEDYPQMIEFVQEVFNYMDQDMGQYDVVSNLLNYTDVDTTLPAFEQVFKAQYLKNFPDVLAADVDLLVKNIRSFYLNKGTEQSYRFLFGALFDSTVNFKYPKFNILRTSDGLWFAPQFIVLTDGSDNIPPQVLSGADYNITQLIGQFITGTSTGAVAFVEDTVILSDEGLTYNGNGDVKALSIVEKEGAFLPGEQLLIGDTLVENGDFSAGSAFWLSSITTDDAISAVNSTITITQPLGDIQPRYIYQSVPIEQATQYWLRYSLLTASEDESSITVGYAPGTDEIYNSTNLGSVATDDTLLLSATAAGKDMIYISLHNSMLNANDQVTFDGISLVKENTANVPILYIANIAAESGIMNGPEQWKDTSGFLSADDETNDQEMFLQDGDEYQDWSYKIRATVDQTRYESIVKDLVHPAGFKMFSAVVATDDLTTYALKSYHYEAITFEAPLTINNNLSGRPFNEIFRPGDHITIQDAIYDQAGTLIAGSELNAGGAIVDTVDIGTMVLRSGFTVSAENLTGTPLQISTGVSMVDLAGTQEQLFSPTVETALLIDNTNNRQVQYFKDLEFFSSGKTIETTGGDFTAYWQAGDTITIEGSRFNNGTYLVDTVTTSTITLDAGVTLIDEQSAIWIALVKSVDNLNSGIAYVDNPVDIDYELRLGLGSTWSDQEAQRESGSGVVIGDWEDLIIGDFVSKATSRFGFIDSVEIDISVGGGASSLLTDLVAWWSLDDAANSTRLDDSVNGYDLTDASSNIGQATGHIGNATSTPGGSTVSLGTTLAAAPELHPVDTDFTISGWIYFNTIRADSGIISTYDFTNGYVLWTPPGSSDVKWTVKSTDVTWSAPATATWHHFVCYHDSQSNEIGIIINDGTPITAAHSTGVDAPTSFFAFQLHRYFNGSATPDCRLDEVAAWSRMLTGAEITELYNSGTGIGYPG